ncbi:MAG: hypothetical protein GY809_01925 [Planctomycetes bacterium]|nr:hypothetical protein [Planctomycetota bacterium]
MTLKDYTHYLKTKGMTVETIQSRLSLLVCVLFLAITVVWIMPTHVDIESYGSESAESFSVPPMPELQRETGTDTEHKPFQGRSGLFKVEAPMNNAPRSDKTVEKLLSQLKLQMIMPQNGKPVAYIILRGKDLKVCSEGDSIEDMVQVTHIDSEDQTIEVLVGGQKETLRL